MKTSRLALFVLGATTMLLPVLGQGTASAGEPAKVIAIFLMESRGSNLSADEVVGLTDFLTARLGEVGRYQIIPRDELRKRLSTTKKQSYKECVDSSCQIEIGRELAAEFSISSAITRVGNQCLITAQVWDLRRATQIKSATGRSSCKPEQLIDAVDKIAIKLDKAMSGKSTTPVVIANPSPTPTAAPPPVKPPTPDRPVESMHANITAGAVRSKHLALAKAVYAPADFVEVRWNGTNGSRYDWVDVVPEGTPDDSAGDYLSYLDKKDGSFRISDLKPGKYHARLYQDYSTKGYVVADRLAFQVIIPDQTPSGLAARTKHLGLAKPVFSSGEAVVIHWFNTPGSKYDWVNVVPKGSADDDAGSNYTYTTTAAGQFKVEGLAPGEYEARIYLDYSNKGYTVGDRISFSVR